MLKFKNVDPCEKAVKLLTWDKVKFEDGYDEKYPVRKVVLTIEAGSVAELIVERYFTTTNEDIKDPLWSSMSISNGFTKPSTFTNCYVLEMPETPIQLTVSGPTTQQKAIDKAHKERIKEIAKEVKKKSKKLLKERNAKSN